MTWHTLPPEIQAIAQRELTDAQLAAWQLELAGHGHRRIALQLDLSRAAVRDRLDNAYRTLRRHGIRQDASGNWYLKETA